MIKQNAIYKWMGSFPMVHGERHKSKCCISTVVSNGKNASVDCHEKKREKFIFNWQSNRFVISFINMRPDHGYNQRGGDKKLK